MFFNDTATTEIYTLSLHDALPISGARRPALLPSGGRPGGSGDPGAVERPQAQAGAGYLDRKSTRLNSSHANISYAVFCLKKKKQNKYPMTTSIRGCMLPSAPIQDT